MGRQAPETKRLSEETRMGRKKIAPEQRENIALALIRCMTRTTYSDTSMQDISKESGLSTGLIFYYFKSKEDILIEALQVSHKLFLSQVEQWGEKCKALSPNLSFKDAMMEYCRLYLGKNMLPSDQYPMNYWCKPYINFWSLGSYSPRAHEVILQNYQDTTNRLREILSANHWTSIDPSFFVSFLFCVLDGAIIYESVFSEKDAPFDADRIIEALFDMHASLSNAKQ